MLEPPAPDSATDLEGELWAYLRQALRVRVLTSPRGRAGLDVETKLIAEIEDRRLHRIERLLALGLSNLPPHPFARAALLSDLSWSCSIVDNLPDGKTDLGDK